MFDPTLIDEDDTHEHVVVEHHMVPMRDGVHLATDVYRPSHGSDMPDESAGRPVVLHRTPYCKVRGHGGAPMPAPSRGGQRGPLCQSPV